MRVLQTRAHPPSEQHSHKKQGTFNVLRRVGFEPTKLKIPKFQLLSIFNLAVCPLIYCDPAGARTQDPVLKRDVHLPTELRGHKNSINGLNVVYRSMKI